MPEELLYFCNVVDGFAPAVCHVCASCFDRLAGFYSAIKLLQRPCTCMFFDHSFLMVARVGSESAVFLPYMDRFTFMFRCCFAFLCTFSSAQFLFYLYPAQFERDGVLSLWYSSVASKTLIQSNTGYPHIQVSVGDGQAGAGMSTRWKFSDRSRICRLYPWQSEPEVGFVWQVYR